MASADASTTSVRPDCRGTGLGVPPLGAWATAALPIAMAAAMRGTRKSMAFSITSARLRETSFPQAFAKWLKALQELAWLPSAGRKSFIFQRFNCMDDECLITDGSLTFR